MHILYRLSVCALLLLQYCCCCVCLLLLFVCSCAAYRSLLHFAFAASLLLML